MKVGNLGEIRRKSSDFEMQLADVIGLEMLSGSFVEDDNCVSLDFGERRPTVRLPLADDDRLARVADYPQLRLLSDCYS